MKQEKTAICTRKAALIDTTVQTWTGTFSVSYGSTGVSGTTGVYSSTAGTVILLILV